MIDQTLLDILVCPETKQQLHMADAELLERLNSAIAEGSLKTRGSAAVGGPLTAGLVREDEQLLFPVRDDIPIMLIDESIPLSQST